MVEIDVKPEILNWACDRSGRGIDEISKKFERFPQWLTGEAKPTYRQLERFAKFVRIPFGLLFLSKPIEQSIPIDDFRTIKGKKISQPSPDLLDTIYHCQNQQYWFQTHAVSQGYEPIELVGSLSGDEKPIDAAEIIQSYIKFDLESRRSCLKFHDAFSMFVNKVENIGILVMVSGVVKHNTHRPLNLYEFRGFALSDPLAPLIFVNGADSKAAQMFTLAHELAHLSRGVSAVSNMSIEPIVNKRVIEKWCNEVAAEILVPKFEFEKEFQKAQIRADVISKLAGIFKVSNMVILRRQLDLGFITESKFKSLWCHELGKIAILNERKGSSSNFCGTAISRVGTRFSKELIRSTLEGNTLYRDACRMLGVSKVRTLNGIGKELGIMN